MAKLHRILKALASQSQVYVQDGDLTPQEADNIFLRLLAEVLLRADALDYQDVSPEECETVWFTVSSQPSSIIAASAIYIAQEDPDALMECGHTASEHAEEGVQGILGLNRALDAAIAEVASDRVTLSIVKNAVPSLDPSLN